jgi:hypothetical protein
MGHQSNYQHNQSTPFIQPASLCSQLFGCAQVKKISAVSRRFQSEARVAIYSARRNTERLLLLRNELLPAPTKEPMPGPTQLHTHFKLVPLFSGVINESGLVCNRREIEAANK